VLLLLGIRLTARSSPVSEFARPISEFASPISEFARPVSEFAGPVSEFAGPIGEFARPVGEFARPVSEFARPGSARVPGTFFLDKFLSIKLVPGTVSGGERRGDPVHERLTGVHGNQPVHVLY
jgi:hypothetical protein